jgi:hypothetical protein
MTKIIVYPHLIEEKVSLGLVSIFPAEADSIPAVCAYTELQGLQVDFSGDERDVWTVAL